MLVSQVTEILLKTANFIDITEMRTNPQRSERTHVNIEVPNG